MRLRGWLQEIRRLTHDQKERMLCLMDEHFLGVSSESFERDLKEKTWVILLEEPAKGTLVGFSTLMEMTAATGSGQGAAIAIYSGDTIIDRAHWGDTELPRVWLRFLTERAAARPEVPTYWFLTSMGHRTYRVLPLFFRSFVPQEGREAAPADKALLDTLSLQKFGSAYDPERGIIHFDPPRERLRPQVGHIPEGQQSNPVIRYFLDRNPRWESGDELACLASIRMDNLTPYALRLLGASRAGAGRQEGRGAGR